MIFPPQVNVQVQTEIHYQVINLQVVNISRAVRTIREYLSTKLSLHSCNLLLL